MEDGIDFILETLPVPGLEPALGPSKGQCVCLPGLPWILCFYGWLFMHTVKPALKDWSPKGKTINSIIFLWKLYKSRKFGNFVFQQFEALVLYYTVKQGRKLCRGKHIHKQKRHPVKWGKLPHNHKNGWTNWPLSPHSLQYNKNGSSSYNNNSHITKR